ncbi:13496_t:CDS:2, partial [Cetraspora pellucida]
GFLITVQNSENRPTIKVFEEEIDLGLDELSNRAEINDSNEVPLARKSPSNNEIMSYSKNPSFLSCTMPGNITQITANRAMTGSPDRTDSDYSSDVDEGDTGTTTTDIDSSPTSCPNTMICDNNQLMMRSPEELEQNEQHSKESITNVDSTSLMNVDSTSSMNVYSTSPMNVDSTSPMDIDSLSNNNTNNNVNTDNQLSEKHQEDKVETTKTNINGSTINLSNGNGVDVESSDKVITSNVSMSTCTPNTSMQEVPTTSATCTIPACTSVFDPMSHGSRFYIKKRIVIGNVSKWIAPEKRDLSLRKYTHKWMVYVTGPPHDLNVTPFIRMVRFFLHPSYRPLDVVDVTEPPFQLTRFGWGEFPIRVQLIFADNKNKPIDLIHNLK